MSTHGALILVGDENVRTVYNHADSYPAYLGERTLGWLRTVLAYGANGEEQARQAISILAPVPNREPTEEDVARLAEFHDPRVSTGQDWYALLRGTQGDIAAMLRAGYHEPADDFPLDSLSCEWAYVVDFDARTFEVYKGSNRSGGAVGRWADLVGMSSGYGPVTQVAVFGFDALPEELPSEDALASGRHARSAPAAIESGE